MEKFSVKFENPITPADTAKLEGYLQRGPSRNRRACAHAFRSAVRVAWKLMCDSRANVASIGLQRVVEIVMREQSERRKKKHVNEDKKRRKLIKSSNPIFDEAKKLYGPKEDVSCTNSNQPDPTAPSHTQL